MQDPHKFLENVIEISQVAGKKILEVYETDFDVEHKEDKTPLTKADMAAHDIIVDGLGKLSSDIPILSEEEAKIPFSERASWETYWLVDPLDGTREFIKRNGEFTVNIALIHQHESILGVIYVPVSGVCYYASRGKGAFKQSQNSAAEQIQVSNKVSNPVKVAGSRSHRGDSLNKFLASIGEYEILSMGSSLKSCLVAEGKADIYPRLGPTSEWDTAAAQCIVEEAGGKLVTLDMEQLRYNTKDELLNPYFLVIGDNSYDWKKHLE
ncbi:MAG: 3'(2'),5'-bisphosphate nucleotidase CysQ [Gammaproteobacteria bacterium]|nr:3'(2'),5'-bisphosphate nucleotidase CysQ [Gammaproteobacteria bacterium]MDH5594753.1 3'(2'),5'-bisphosphate nucleotidase CysQ [Gammaproteobacteria bacterium]MDH5614236.1 3'(2'),5'-bisphosphate nucleotidase CysQ [Gammaproteobacteria bacterium]